MNYKRFEELPCWQVVRELCKAVFELIIIVKLKMILVYAIKCGDHQVQMDNIAEGFDDGSTPEFIRF